jgi:hypothetical protein
MRWRSISRREMPRQVTNELRERLEAASRCADADDGWPGSMCPNAGRLVAYGGGRRILTCVEDRIRLRSQLRLDRVGFGRDESASRTAFTTATIGSLAPRFRIPPFHGYQP